MKPKPIFKFVCSALAGVIFSIAPPAHADIFGYIDAAGDTHFSTEKLDDRYQIFLKGERSFDSSELTRQVASPATSPLLRAVTQHPNLKKYEPVLLSAAREFHVDAALMKAMMAAESGFNPQAVSPKGAIGLMQIMPATAERYGVTADAKVSIQQKLIDPKTNLRLAARYLRDLTRLFPNRQPLVIASYNAGEGAVQKYRNTVPPFPETRNYVQLVTQFYDFYRPTPPRTPAAGKATDTEAGATAQSSHRVHLTIPGRANLPPAPAR